MVDLHVHHNKDNKSVTKTVEAELNQAFLNNPSTPEITVSPSMKALREDNSSITKSKSPNSIDQNKPTAVFDMEKFAALETMFKTL